MEPAALLIVLVLAVGVFITLLVGLTIVVSLRELHMHYYRTVKEWARQGAQFVCGPVIASFLNERRWFGMRGNGTLAVLPGEIRFLRPTAQRAIVIPITDVEHVALESTFNGRTSGGPFLVIRRKAGDLTGFKVRDAEKWLQQVSKLIKP